MLCKGDGKALVLCLDGCDEIGKTLTGFLFDILIRMILDDGAKEIDCFLYVGIVHLFELLDEHIQHRNGNFCLLCLICVDILFIFFLLLILLSSSIHKGNFLLDDFLN